MRMWRAVVRAWKHVGWIMAGRPSVTIRAGGCVEGASFHNVPVTVFSHPLAPEGKVHGCHFYSSPSRLWTDRDTRELVESVVASRERKQRDG